MQHLPLFADLQHRAVLVVGGGVVAERRVTLLLEAGAAITVIAPELTERLGELAADGRFAHLPRAFAADSLEPYWLVIAATDDRAVNAAVATAAAAAKRFCNVVDDQELCTFIMPAIVDRSPVTIAIGSSGLSPVLARWIKGVIETLLPARLGALAELAGRWRQRVREQVTDPTERRHFWERVVTGVVAEHAFAGRDADAEQALEQRSVELGQRRYRPPRRSLSRRRGTRRYRLDHDSRPAVARDGRRRALRPARERRALAVRAPRRRAHLRRQDAAPAVDLAEAAESLAREPRAIGQARLPAQGRRPVHLRPRRRGARSARRSRAQVPGRARRLGGRRLRGLCRHPADVARRCASRAADDGPHARRRHTDHRQAPAGPDARAVHGRRAVRGARARR